MKIGVQLYTLRDSTQNPIDFEKTISFLNSIGVDTIQLSGAGNFAIEQKKEILDKYNISVCATHNDCDRFVNDLDAILREQKILNCKVAGLGCLETKYNNPSFIPTFSEIAKRVKDAGLQFAYHNHGFEFKKQKGVSVMDRLIEETPADDFHFIADLCWVQIAKENPLDLLDRLKNRVEVVHIKDFKKTLFSHKFVTLGQGKCDIKSQLAHCKDLNIPYAVYEQDSGFVDNDPFKETKLSYSVLQNTFKSL